MKWIRHDHGRAFAFYGGAGAGLKDVVVKGFVDTATLLLWSWVLAGIPGWPATCASRMYHLRSTQISSPFGFNYSRVLYGRGLSHQSQQQASSGRFPLINCSWEHDGGQIYIDGGDSPLTHYRLRELHIRYARAGRQDYGSAVVRSCLERVKVDGTRSEASTN